MVKFVVTLYVLECSCMFWFFLELFWHPICDLISAANGCRMVSMNSLCHQVAERLQLVIAPASQEVIATNWPQRMATPLACKDSVRNTFILVASWQKSAWNLSWSNSHLKKVSVLVYRMISSSTWSRLLRMAFNIQDTIQQFYSREPFLWFDIQVATHQKFC